MKINQIVFAVLLIIIASTLFCVNASDNTTSEISISNTEEIAVEDNSLQNLIKKALNNDTIYLEDKTYEGIYNTQITIDKSINIVGKENTVINGANERFIFIINDNAKVSFKNIKFINASKTGLGSDIYGGALEIHNAEVTIDNCQFISNSINYGKSDNIYGAAISNEGNLSILNSIFSDNSLNSGYKHEGFGGALYNNGYLYINNTSFIRSRAGEYSKGGVLYNNNVALINNSILSDTYSFEESMGSAIFNNGDLTLINSIIENNTIERNNFNFIFGNIFNSGQLIAYQNIFKNNTAYYKQPNSGYTGCPTIYNTGDLNLSYNAFINNVGGFKNIYRDVYLNGGKSVYIDNNWWGSNDNPFATQAINIDKVNTWLIFDVEPLYSTLNINESINIKASWKLNNNLNPQYLIPFEVIFKDEFGHIQKNNLANNNAVFRFNNTQNKGLCTINVSLNSFNQIVSVDVGKLKTYIEVTFNDNIFSNETLLINVKLYDENSNAVSGIAYLSLKNKTYIVNIDDGESKAEFTNLIPGNYELKIDYAGGEDYFKSSVLLNLTVKKYPVNLVVEEIGDVYVDENFTINVNLKTGQAEGASNLYINGIFKQVIYLKYGDTIISFSNFESGRYNLTIETLENEYYQQTNASAVFNVKKYNPKLHIASANIFINENETLKITAADDFKGEVILSINNVNYTLFLNNKTTDITLSNLSYGSYDVDLIFDGNGKFSPQNTSASFKVQKYPSKLIVNIDDNVINVKASPDNCTGNVSVYINRKYYQLTLINGEANFNVEFDEGTNYIYVLYAGDDYFDQSSFNTTIGEGEAIAIVGVNVTSWQYNDFNYTVQIFEKNGLAIPNKLISIKINSKTYEVMTNHQGMGILPFNLNEGYYEVISTYKNLTARNYLTVNPISFNLTSNNITYGQNTVIIAEFNKTITGKVNFTLSNGLSKIINISEGLAVCTFENLNPALWQVTAFYTNDLFTSNNLKTTFEVEKLNSQIELEIKEVFVGEDEVIKAIANNLTGNITFLIDNDSYTINIINQTAEIILSNLSGGNHILNVEYSGDDYHKNTLLSQNFTIKTQKTSIVLSVNETSYGEDINIIARVNINASGFIRFKINDLSVLSQIKDGIAYGKFNSFNVGKYRVYADYLSDNQFLTTHNSTEFSIIKANSTIELYTNSVVLGENIRIYAKLSPNATGKVSFRMIDYYSPRDKDVMNSTASWYIAPLEYGKYRVIATYSGDNNYFSSTNTYLLNVSQIRSVLTVDAKDVSSRDDVIIKVGLISGNGENISGEVVIELNSKSYKINVRDGKGSFNLGKISPANYSGSVIYKGCESYSSSMTDFDFTVSESLLKSNLTCENITKYYSNNAVKFVITLKNSKNIPICDEEIVTVINGVERTYITDNSGNVYLDINDTLGKYDIYAYFKGSSSYYPSNTSGSVEVLSTIESDDVVKLYGSGIQYFALFKDSNGKALANTNVIFNIAGKNYNYTTFPNGIVRLNINFKVGVYTIIAYNPQTGQQLINYLTIYNSIVGNTDVVNYFGAVSTYKIQIYGNDGKAVGAGFNVTFKLNGKTYTVKTDKNGYAQISAKLKVNQYVITTEFNGTVVYNKITVKPVLTFKISTTKKKIKLKAKLINTKGKAVKGKKIIFKIKNKKYKVKTNKKGIASINLKLKLKKGKYKIYAIYSKSKVSYTIKVK